METLKYPVKYAEIKKNSSLNAFLNKEEQKTRVHKKD